MTYASLMRIPLSQHSSENISSSHKNLHNFMQLLDLFPDICLNKLSYDVVHASIFQRSCLLSYFAFANWLCTNILDIWDCTLFDFYWAQWCINRDDLGFELENETSLFLVIEKAPLSCSQLFFR